MCSGVSNLINSIEMFSQQKKDLLCTHFNAMSFVVFAPVFRFLIHLLFTHTLSTQTRLVKFSREYFPSEKGGKQREN